MTQNSFQRLYQHRIDHSTKPFHARGAKILRCRQCQVAKQYCLCAVKPIPQQGVSVLLLLSENEVLKPSNTGRLVADVISDTHAIQWSRTNPEDELLAIINNPKYFPIILFPEQYVEDRARLVTTTSDLSIEPDKNILLILLDGSWREARRMFRKSPYLNHLPVLSILPKQLSQYLMRKSVDQTHLSTAEVATVALKQLGFMSSAISLTHWFEAFREAYLLSKSQKKGNLDRPALNQLNRFDIKSSPSFFHNEE
jgi:DTW domain-containing protein